MNHGFLGAASAILLLVISPLLGGERVAMGLKDPEGKLVKPLADHGQKATVLFFLTTECPIGNLYSPEINRIVEHYEKQGVTFHAVYAHETAAEVQKHQRDYKLSLRALLDPEVKLAKLTGATVMPEACVLGKEGKIRYRGRIDDRAVKFGTVRAEPRVRDLRLALDAVLAGNPVAKKITKPIGCYISFPEIILPKPPK
ncbi:MAG: redoxin domain-containing protein [Akkermansiaceae bacterium]